MPKDTIIIIDDSFRDFQNSIEEIGEKFKFIPKDRNDFSQQLKRAIANENLFQYFKTTTQPIYNNILAIITDYQFKMSNGYDGLNLIKDIRNWEGNNIELKQFMQNVPIIMQSNQYIHKEAIANGADYFTIKNHGRLKSTIEKLI